MSSPLMRTIESARADPRRALEDEVADYRGRSMQWRARVLSQLVKGGWAILETRPDRDRVLALDDDPGAEYYEMLRRRRAAVGAP